LYDSIGELTKDTANGIKRITWTVYGKVQSVKKYNGDSLYFVYDAMQNRIEKIYLPNGGSRVATFYERDAQGNIISTYSRTEDATNFYFTQTEEPIYGSDRLGEYKQNIFTKSEAKANYDRGPFWIPSGLASKTINIIPVMNNVYVHVLINGQSHIMVVPFAQRPVKSYTINVPNTTGHYYRKINDKVYELKDHLGDVRVTVSDRKDSANTPNMLSYNNNYAFGMAQPSRAYNLGNYRFSFNGKEHDDEIYGTDNSYDYGGRFYDNRLGKWFKTDKLSVVYTGASPYSAMLDNPVLNSDNNGDFVIAEGKDKDRLQSIVDAAKKALENPFLMEELVKYSQLSEDQIRDIFTNGHGPILRFSRPTDDFENNEFGLVPAKTDPNIPFSRYQTGDEIILSDDIFNNNYPKDDPHQFLETITLLHELVHLGDLQDFLAGNNPILQNTKDLPMDQINSAQSGYEPDYLRKYYTFGIEPGKAFEVAVANFAVGLDVNLGNRYNDYQRNTNRFNRQQKREQRKEVRAAKKEKKRETNAFYNDNSYK